MYTSTYQGYRYSHWEGRIRATDIPLGGVHQGYRYPIGRGVSGVLISRWKGLSGVPISHWATDTPLEAVYQGYIIMWL